MEAVFYVYLISLFLISVVGFVRFNNLTKAFKILTILILCTLISESVRRIVGRIYLNSMPVAHVWCVVEFTFLASIYYHLIINKRMKKAIVVSIIAMFALEVINFLFFEKLTQFPSLILEASHIVYVAYSLLLFRQMLLAPAEQSLFKQSLFWFNINVLFYATTMFLNFALLSYFIQNKLDVNPLIYFNLIVNYIFYIVIGIVLLIDNRKVKLIGASNG